MNHIYSEYLATAKKPLKDYLNQVSDWMTANWWKLTGNKTKSSQFCAMTKLSKMHYQEKHVDAIRASSYVRHLGGMFDNQLNIYTYIKHILKMFYRPHMFLNNSPLSWTRRAPHDQIVKKCLFEYKITCNIEICKKKYNLEKYFFTKRCSYFCS